jgi:hypothetical protein
MVTVGLLVPLHAKPGKEEDVARFLEGGLALVNDEPETTAWFALRLGPTEFAVFDPFRDDSGRQGPPLRQGCRGAHGAGFRTLRGSS